jgi:hypothetical protein
MGFPGGTDIAAICLGDRLAVSAELSLPARAAL